MNATLIDDAAMSREAASHAPRRSLATILVVDDEDEFRGSIAEVLRRGGYDTLEADDGRSGIELAQEQQPDLVLCDVNMERMNGYQTLERLRGEPATATMPVILMTGMGDTTAMRKGMDLGADDYLPKPFTAPELFSAIDARLRQRDVLRRNAERKLDELRASLTLALPHEMVTPLNGIFGLAQLLVLEASSLSAAEIADFGQNILASAERLQHTVQNFLLYGRLELLASNPAGLAEFRDRRTDSVRGAIEGRARHHAGAAGRPDDLQLDLAEGSVGIASDLFTRLVDELAENAFKFSQAGQRVRLANQFDAGRFQLTVVDQGIGMTRSQVASLSAYTQFNRGVREQQGAGLGLAIVKRLAELHGGEMRISSKPGEGTTVSVVLPAA